MWHLEQHLDRLFRARSSTTWTCPYSTDDLVRATKDVIRANGLESCYVRPIAIRGYGEMGVNPLNAPVNVAIAAWPWGAYLGEEALEQGVRIKISQLAPELPERAAGRREGRPADTSTAILAKIESLKAGYDEAIMLNEAGFITDGSGENVFIVRDGIAVHAADPGGLPRRASRGASVIALGRDRGYDVREENLVRTDLYNAEECLLHRHRRRDHADPRGGRPAGRRRAPRPGHEGAAGRLLRRDEGRGPEASSTGSPT